MQGLMKQLVKIVGLPAFPQKENGCFLLKSENFAFVGEKADDGYYVCDITRKRYLQNLCTRIYESLFLNIAVVWCT